MKDAKGQCIESVRLIKVIDMRKLIVLAALLALSGAAFADSGGEGNNTGCNGQGNANSPCDPSSGGGGGGGGGTDPNTGGQWQGQAQGQFQFQGQAQGQAQSQEANATAVAGAIATSENRNTNTNMNANVNNVSVDNTVTNSATGGSVTVGDTTNTNTNTANGGEGGSAAASAVIAEGAVNVNIQDGALRGAPVSLSTEYVEVRQAPSVAQGSFAISGCSVGGNAGGSNIHGSAFLGFGWTPQECYKFMLAQAYQSIGEKKAVCDILRNTKVGRRLERDGVELPECVEQVVVIATPVAPDMSKFATKEEVNEKVDRAFRASQTK